MQRLQLSNYDDEELLRILARMIRSNSMTVEGGLYGPYPRILARRVGRRREGTGFANAHGLKLEFDKVLERQATRLQKMRARDSSVEDQTPEDNCLTMVDIVGPEPEDIRSRSAAWKDLNKMAGLKNVKSVVERLVSRAKTNYYREISGMKLVETPLHRVFLGPSGTGKTTVAKLYGHILAETGLLSTRHLLTSLAGTLANLRRNQARSSIRLQAKS